jgi:formylmethanofuran dehydrogenase subunit C
MKQSIPAGRVEPPGTAAASGRFGPFKPESEKAVRMQKVETNQAIEKMKKTWEGQVWEWCNVSVHYGVTHNEKTYSGILDSIKHRYSAKDVEVFSVHLSEFQGEMHFSLKAGLFLSALINNCKGDDFVVHTTAFAEPVEALGYRNTRNITVEGDVGYYVGEDMGTGTIAVKGNADGNVGWYMRGGSITVEGNANEVGHDMIGGRIIVNGNAGDDIGNGMTGGEILINGTVGSISEHFSAGRIFHKEKLIAGK